MNPPAAIDAALALHPAAVELSGLPATGDALPFFLMGESMGGAVAIGTSATGRFPFVGVMLIAPMCGVDPVGASVPCGGGVGVGRGRFRSCSPCVRVGRWVPVASWGRRGASSCFSTHMGAHHHDVPCPIPSRAPSRPLPLTPSQQSVPPKCVVSTLACCAKCCPAAFLIQGG